MSNRRTTRFPTLLLAALLVASCDRTDTPLAAHNGLETSTTAAAADHEIAVGDSVFITEPKSPTPGKPAVPPTPDRWVRKNNPNKKCPPGWMKNGKYKTECKLIPGKPGSPAVPGDPGVQLQSLTPTIVELRGAYAIGLAEGEGRIKVTDAKGTRTVTVRVLGEATPPPTDDPPPPSGDWTRVLRDTTVIGDVVVPDGEVWLIGPNVRVQGNVRTVNGTIALRPGSSLTFVGGDPATYLGGGMHYTDAFARDYGLWIGGMGATGRLDISCTPKRGWNRTGSDPTWKSTDEYWIAPTDLGEYLPKRWSPGQPIPRIDLRVPAAEVANVTRDCSITAEPAGHIHIHSTAPQRIEYVRLEGMGVTIPGREDSGRYAIHLHMMRDGARGTVIRGVAAVDSRGRVYVPHVSHGVTMDDNVSVNSWSSALWWDSGDATDDLTVDRLAVLGVRMSRDLVRNSKEDGILLEGGTGLTLTNSVVSGVRGHPHADGIFWPVDASRPAVWRFQDNVAHNNDGVGMRFYLRTSESHDLFRSFTYRNGDAGVKSGDYSNVTHWLGLTLIEDELRSGAGSRVRDDGNPLRFVDLRVVNPRGPAIQVGLMVENRARTEFINCELEGTPKLRLPEKSFTPFVALFRDCNLTPDDIEVPTPIDPDLEGTHILIEHRDGRKWEITLDIVQQQKVVRSLTGGM